LKAKKNFYLLATLVPAVCKGGSFVSSPNFVCLLKLLRSDWAFETWGVVPLPTQLFLGGGSKSLPSLPRKLQIKTVLAGTRMTHVYTRRV